MVTRFSTCARAWAVLLLIASGFAVAEEPKNELANPGFEEGDAGGLKGWTPYGKGFVVDTAVFRGGKQSIKCVSEGEKGGMGVGQIIRYDKPDKRPIIIGGWSKTDGVSGGGEYCIYLDIFYDDGTPAWGKTSDWSRRSHDWEYGAQVHWPAKPVKEIRAYVFLRRTTGTVWFDDVKLCRGGLHLTDLCVASDYPRSRNGVHLSAGLTQDAEWTCEFFGATGTRMASCTAYGKKILWLLAAPGKETPQTIKLVAETKKKERMEFETKVNVPPPPANPVREGYVVWAQSSMAKVYPTECPTMPPPAPEARLSLARNEREGLQIAVKPADAAPLKGVRIEVGKFVNEAGDVFPAELIQWHVVGYVWVHTPSGHPSAPAVSNWCPDVLLPAGPFDVTDGRTQTVWLNFFASETVKPGTYRGAVAVRPENAKPQEVTVSVKVRPFALPRTPRMKTAFAIMDGFTKKTYGEITPALRRRCLDIMLDHRLNPDDISRTEPPLLEDLLYARDRGMNTFNITNLVPKPKDNPTWVCYSPMSAYGPGFTQELAARLDDYIAQLRKHGLSKMAYVYGFDERGEEYDDLIKGICKFLKERYPEVSTFTTAGYMYTKREKTPPGYQDWMDWYCPLTPRYTIELSDKLRVLGKQVWWYVCCGPQYPYANFASTDYPSIEGRLLGWMTYGYKADGLLYWHVNYWGNNSRIEGGSPYLDWESPCIARMTGDGVLTYPAADGPVSCIRLENIRDGIEDYDYLSLLADAKGREAAMKHYERLVKDMKNYTRSPEDLYKVRDELGDAVEAAGVGRGR